MVHRLLCTSLVSLTFALSGCAGPSNTASQTQSLVFGEKFVLHSGILNEDRTVNVFTPTMYGEPFKEPLPMLYVLDGGMNEDFLHIAGLVQVLVSNQTMRPFLLIGIPNTQRRRDLTSPTLVEEEKKIAPVVGGSDAFRHFLIEELIPAVHARYRTTQERAIVGESLAGLFAIETCFRNPDLFDTYIAIDPTLYWNNAEPARVARSSPQFHGNKTLYFASSNEPSMAALISEFAEAVDRHKPSNLRFHHVPFPEESHATIYHPAALDAFRRLFAPRSGR